MFKIRDEEKNIALGKTSSLKRNIFFLNALFFYLFFHTNPLLLIPLQLIAGFIKSPLSQKKLTEESVELHCEAIGNPIPEIQWWFEGADPNGTAIQLWDGAWQNRVQISAAYQRHSSSTIAITNLMIEDSGTYECWASNDPDRNHLSKSPKVKWIRSQANVIVTKREWQTLTCRRSHGHRNVSNITVPVPPTSPSVRVLIPKVDYETSGEYHCVFDTMPLLKATVYVKVAPHVVPYKKMEHGNEGDSIMLTCKCNSYPPVTQWNWYKMVGQVPQPVANGTEERFYIQSNGTRTDLRIVSLDLEKDPANYVCNATNEMGEGSAEVNLRVRSWLAALWPFLGIVAEVLVLVTIIFIYEKRRKPNEVPEGKMMMEALHPCDT
ncbi:hypothetical protein E2320_022033 [Naja naja]|nr:hypothetical protein E2320_022033 [Naja naja]